MLDSIDIENFRCIERASLQFHERGTGIVGPNGSGKTSLLEAIFFLGHGRSFRSTPRAKLIRRGTDFLRLVSRLTTERRSLVASAEHTRGSTTMKLAGRGVSGVAEIAEVLPIQVIDPGVHRLIDEGSVRRRRLVDWGVFHVKHDFIHFWRRYQRALQQRNAALREGLEDRVVHAWDEELVTTAHQIDAARAEYASVLRPRFVELASDFLGESAELEYRKGWSDDRLEVSLVAARERDRRYSATTVGPHRADLAIKVDGVLARDRVSRGQQKLVASALILAQISVHSESRPQLPTCLLMDDPAAELDVDKLGKLLGAIAKLPAQLIVSSVTGAGLKGIDIGRTFHVEQGRFMPML